jgi:hypothetical protein
MAPGSVRFQFLGGKRCSLSARVGDSKGKRGGPPAQVENSRIRNYSV